MTSRPKQVPSERTAATDRSPYRDLLTTLARLAMTFGFVVALSASIASIAFNATDASAQASSDPISGDAPLAVWSLTLEDVVVIPDSAGQAPRLEQLVSNPSTGLAYVIDQRGSIYSFDPNAANPTATLFLDLATTVGSLNVGNETGVRSMAFHPGFDNAASAGHRKMYTTLSQSLGSTATGNPVAFSSPGTAVHFTVIGEWTLNANGSVDVSSYRELIRIEQPFSNHNGGHLGFNPHSAPATTDYGMLYISLGDGGSEGGPFDLSQDIDEIPVPYPHGKILRIDPIASGAAPYAIPPDNPFAGVANRVEEIWAYGFRNPHKFNWDSATGRLYVSDIGQGVIEELSLVRAGGNYGWNEREGSFVFTSDGSVSPLPANHATDAFAYPVAQYDHSDSIFSGTAAIVGGPIYRGIDLPELSGFLFFADFATTPGPIYAIHVSEVVERNDFTNVTSLNGGRLAPDVEVQIRDGGVDQRFRDFLRDANALPSLSRTDTRWGEGPDGEIFILNKHDGVVRRIAGVVDFPNPVPGLGILGAFGLGMLALTTGRRLLGDRSELAPRFCFRRSVFRECLSGGGSTHGRPPRQS